MAALTDKLLALGIVLRADVTVIVAIGTLHAKWRPDRFQRIGGESAQYRVTEMPAINRARRNAPVRCRGHKPRLVAFDYSWVGVVKRDGRIVHTSAFLKTRVLALACRLSIAWLSRKLADAEECFV